jgi:16S rRNA (guanine966-N2)-methyltransferase
MRIISGKFRGRQLVSFEADHIRPTTDRVKESWFNILQGSWEGARVLDLFSGTGNLSFEALSRGASFVEAVESNVQSTGIILKNQALLKVSKEEFRLVIKDVFKFLADYKGLAFDVILIDPPFTEKIAHSVMESLSKSKVWRETTIIGIESSKQERMDSTYQTLVQSDQRAFGDKILTFFGDGSQHN